MTIIYINYYILLAIALIMSISIFKRNKNKDEKTDKAKKA